LTRTNDKVDPIEAEVSGSPFPMKLERRLSALITASFFSAPPNTGQAVIKA
jgi:hypothetical protein